MAEIKHTFTGGKMNKDVDERLVPNGEFRDALNVQVRTTDSDAVGAVQNVKGTALIGSSFFDSNWMNPLNQNTLPRCVASVADEKNDKAYFFFASPPLEDFIDSVGSTTANLGNAQHVLIDSIIEQDANGTSTPIAVDKHTIISRFSDIFAETSDSSVPGFYDPNNFQDGWTSFEVVDASQYRVDMTIKALALNDSDQLVDLFTYYQTEGGTITTVASLNGAKIKAIDYENNIITLYEEQETNLSGVLYFLFEAKPALNFQGNQITGVNIVDNLLFWTDNKTEPKKLNIDRGREGTVDISTHTKLYVKHPILSNGPDNPAYVEIDEVSPGLEDYPTNTDLREEHLTVLRRAPRTAPTLEMSNTLRSSDVSVDFEWQFYDGVLPTAIEGASIVIGPVTAFGQTGFNVGDIVTIGQTDDPAENPGAMVGTFLNYVDDLGGNVYEPSQEPTSWVEIKLSTVVQPIPAQLREWRMSTKEAKPIFELKFARFGYRYKYTDGEYSAFSPWSELAFMPGEFDLVIKKAYNLGMVNGLRELFIKDFIPYKTPLDVAAVEILYKSANEPNVYTIKTINKTKDDEWENHTPSFVNTDEIRTGRMQLTTEMVHKVLASNQILRAWDNVPRRALAQEITGNRLVYGNYTQGYDLKYPVGLKQFIVTEDEARLEDPQKSVKTIRQYKWGMVFGDKYGRETPVIESTKLGSDLTSLTGDVVNPKDNSKFRNHFELQQEWSSVSFPNAEPPEWVDYVKYYVKEPTQEYYNMVMDRWYWADYEKDNVWLSFNSSDRNKVDEETYLILKNQHGNHNAVLEPARYKIIAIENDAPEYIRTVNRPLGTVRIYPYNTTSQNFGNTPINGGWPQVSTIWDTGITLDTAVIPSADPVFLMTQTSCQIHVPGSWNDTISGWAVGDVGGIATVVMTEFSNSLFSRRVDGAIKFRVRGQDANDNKIYTEWRSIYHYRFIEIPEGAAVATDPFTNATQKIELSWNQPFGEQANMYQQFLDNGYDETTLGMYFEFVEEAVNNQPQFDGKFFCKVERNLTLDANVLYSEGSGGIYFNKLVYNLLHKREIGGNFATCGNSIATRNYWNHASYLASSINSPDWSIPGYSTTYHSVFYDQARPAYARYVDVPQLDGTTAIEIYGNGYQEMEPAIAPGTLEDGTMGRMTLSRPAWTTTPNLIYDVDSDGNYDVEDYTVGSETYTPNQSGIGFDASEQFFAEMSIPGTLFKFNGYDVIFIITNVSVGTGPGGVGGVRNYTGVMPDPDPDSFMETVQYVSNGCNGSLCGPGGTGNGQCYRFSRKIDFRRMDEDTGQPAFPETGLNLGTFNPLGILNHGNGDSTGIRILKPSDIFGSPGIKQELGGCWETEPKESVEIDIYHEASNAIPVRLNQYNSFDFAPVNSPIIIKRWVDVLDQDTQQTSTVLQEVPLTYEHHQVSNIEFTNDTSLIYMTSSPSGNPDLQDPHIYDVAIGDYMIFTHPDGTQTKAEVTNYYKPVSTPVTGDVPFVPAYNVYVEMTYNPTVDMMVISGGSDFSGAGVGMNVQALGSATGLMPLGTVLTGIILPGQSGTVGTVSFNSSPGSWDWEAIGIDLSAIESQADYPVVGVFINEIAGYYELDTDVWKQEVKLGWFNCYSFGNGVESDRVRDDFNAAQIGNGPKVSTTFSGYGEEHRGSGMIYSGLYNSTSEVNDLNEFNMGEKIQKDLNPDHGTIQALKTRETDVVVFAEDRVLKVLANKEAVFNADGNPQLTATNRVLGTAVPFGSNYGISKDPSSLAVDQYRMYFTDRQRGAVLRLSMDGITPISDAGMKSWFRDNIRRSKNLLGTFDDVNGEYNLTLEYNAMSQDSYNDTTVSFNEGAKGWVSFKSFVPQAGESVSGKYITAQINNIWEHHREFNGIDENQFLSDGITPNPNYGEPVKVPYNNFYGVQYESTFNVTFNDMPSVVKHFNTINYEGSQSKVNLNVQDKEFYNLEAKKGWYISEFTTDLQSGDVPEFIEKENKWFNRIRGEQTTLKNLDTSEFTVQGLGNVVVIGGDFTTPEFEFIVQNLENDSIAVISDELSISSPEG